ncbi:esterase [Acidovorax sp. SRB_14]|uniref:YqiA/YcfP family alpha/beta fold hydrolase n=1 Tax=Acidovorax sp. SRB_14 TaxID=1962699 RepID=UPI001563D21A|nr:YqiA/YcfP family alpha/beta fold hydrolase [Acidovorax sp. SRB_14]NMM81890.1 esterase [Acidovorax sp. SRB_14]
MATTHLLYLHGFRSSPQSAKARLMAAHVVRHHPGVQFWCPQLPPSPRAAMDLVSAGIAGWPHAHMAVVGSSLGGFYASWVAQQTGCPSVLLNPAVDPARDLARHIGDQTAWHDPAERFYFDPAFIGELRALDVRDQAATGPQLAVVAKGDELLDWREMVARYPQAQLLLLEGGDHALSDFAEHIARVAQFLQLAPASA